MQSTRDKEGDRHPPSRLSITACFRCREQKLKCDRGHPVCGRCNRLGAECAYPAPPDRRGPRGKRKQRPLRAGNQGAHDGAGAGARPEAGSGSPETLPSGILSDRPTPPSSVPRLPTRQNPKAHVAPSDDAVGCTSTGLATEYPVLSGSYQNQLRTSTSLASESSLESSQPPPLPPTSLGLALLEVYFARIYNASILFHKPLLFQQYIEGKIHRALLRALFAMATLFLHPMSDDSRATATSSEELKVLSIYQPSGLPWARAALTEAMQLVMHSPSLMVVQALQCVQLYWFGVGQPLSGDLCVALAYRSSQILGFNKRLAQDNDGSSESIETELGRRCYWACWLSTCIVMEPEPYIDSAWKEAAMLPLPGTISSSSQGWRVNHNQAMDKYWHTISVQFQSGTTDTRPATAAGSFIKMIGVWAKVQLLCKDRPSSITSSEVTSVHHFSELATILFHDATSARGSTFQDDDAIEVQNLYIFHDAIYHQCQIMLHSLLVPLFSGIPADRNIDNHRQAQVQAAETVLNHADHFAHLLAPYLRGDEDVSRLPPLLVYGAFVVGMVLLSTDAARRNQVVTEKSASSDQNTDRLIAVKQIVRVLDILRASWRALQQPWEVLSSAFQPYVSKISEKPNTRDRQPLLRSRDQVLPKTKGATDQTANISVARPYDPVTGSNLGGYAVGVGNTATGAIGDAAALNVGLGEVAAVPYTGQTDLFADSEWYGLSLAEAGVEQLVGYEPSSLFLQGWKAFS